MVFESTISLGAVISIGVTFMSTTALVVGFAWAIKVNVAVLDVRLTGQDDVIKEIKDEVKKLNQVVIDMAASNYRVEGIERRLVLQGERVDRLENRFLFGVKDG